MTERKGWEERNRAIEALRSGSRGARRLRHFSLSHGPTLDLCCGDGKYLPFLPQPVGIDISLGQLGPLSALPLVQGDAFSLPFGPGLFGGVFIGDSLHHFSFLEQEQALKEAWRVLRPGGRLYVAEPAPTLLRKLAHLVIFSPLSKVSAKTRAMRRLLEAEWDNYYNDWLTHWSARIGLISSVGFRGISSSTGTLYYHGEYQRD